MLWQELLKHFIDTLEVFVKDYKLLVLYCYAFNKLLRTRAGNIHVRYIFDCPL